MGLEVVRRFWVDPMGVYKYSITKEGGGSNVELITSQNNSC